MFLTQYFSLVECPAIVTVVLVQVGASKSFNCLKSGPVRPAKFSGPQSAEAYNALFCAICTTAFYPASQRSSLGATAYHWSASDDSGNRTTGPAGSQCIESSTHRGRRPHSHHSHSKLPAFRK